MAVRIAAFDWSKTSLGPSSAWPHCLKVALDIMIPAQAQIVMFWGEELLAFYNDSYAQTIGDKHPHALGRPARQSWGELWEDLEPLLLRVLHGGETIVAKDRAFYIERHGYPENVYFDISFSPVHDEAGKVHGVFCIVNETTERVKTDRALRESEERFRSIITQTSSGIFKFDLEGRVILVNNRFGEMVGYSEAELLRMQVRDLIYEDDLPEFLRLSSQIAGSGESFEIENRYVRKDNSLVWVSNSVSALRDGEGAVREAVSVVVDITERKRTQEAERRLAAIIASSDDAILSTDLGMNITSWNAGAEKLYGYSADDAIGRSVLILVPGDRQDEEPAIIRQISAGQKVDSYETKRRRKDGQLVEVLLSVSPIYDAYGRIVGASKIAHDISARKETERLQAMLTGELNHRVKNVLATVIAIARQTLGRSESAKALFAEFDARLASMSRAHDLLMHGSWEEASLMAVVEQSISPYQRDSFEISGPDIQLAPKAVLSLSLALHELATNAAKYGALSVPTGRVIIAWSLLQDERPRLHLRWQEIGGPPVAPPTHAGFGSRLIQSVVSSELAGEVKIAYEATGLLFEIDALAGPAWESGDRLTEAETDKI